MKHEEEKSRRTLILKKLNTKERREADWFDFFFFLR